MNIFVEIVTLPPQNLISHVNGGEDTCDGWYNKGGLVLAINLNLALVKYCNKNINSYKNILDFGIGCNRVLSHIPSTHNMLTGIDIDEAVILYNKQTFDGKYFVSPTFPPIGVLNDTYDLIWSFSVFSHLPCYLAKLWIKELYRITSFGGNIILTTHLENMSSAMINSNSELFETYKKNGYIQTDYNAILKTNSLNNNDNYKNMYYTREYFTTDILQGLFKILYISNGNDPFEFLKDDTDITIKNKLENFNIPTYQEFIILEKV